MKKLASCILALVLLIGCFVPASAADIELKTAPNKSDFNLIEYLKNTPVATEAEFLAIISENGGELAISSIQSEATHSTTNETEQFSYFIDEENQTVHTTTINCGEEVLVKPDALTRSTVSLWQRTASAEHKAYSVVGIHIYTVSADAIFQYDKQSFCNVIQSHGYFNPAFLSLWSASTWISDGNYSVKKAYSETYGTANLNFGIAEIIGITLNFQTVNYSLQLNCDYTGDCTGYYKEAVV